MVDALVSWGYQRGTSVRAAPYDFRYAPGGFLLFYQTVPRAWLQLRLQLMHEAPRLGLDSNNALSLR